MIPIKTGIIINLDNRNELLPSFEKFKNQWRQHGKTIQILNGIDYRNKTHVINYFLKSNRLNLNGYGFRHKKEALIGEIGYYMSHYNCWKYIVDNKLDGCLILDHGVNFLRTDFDSLLIDNNLDILFINEENKIDYKKNIVGIGLQGYIITQKGAQNLMEKCFVLSLPIDLQIRNLCNTKEIKGDVINTPFVKDNNNKVSSIDGLQLGINPNINDSTINDSTINDNKQNKNNILQRLFYNLLEKNVNLDDYI